MGWSFTMGSIAGTAIRIHITFLLFLAWIFFASYMSGGAEAASQSLVFMLLLFACVVAHVVRPHLHGAPVRRDHTDGDTAAIGGVAQLERIPEKPWEEFLVAIAVPPSTS